MDAKAKEFEFRIQEINRKLGYDLISVKFISCGFYSAVIQREYTSIEGFTSTPELHVVVYLPVSTSDFKVSGFDAMYASLYLLDHLISSMKQISKYDLERSLFYCVNKYEPYHTVEDTTINYPNFEVYLQMKKGTHYPPVVVEKC